MGKKCKEGNYLPLVSIPVYFLCTTNFQLISEALPDLSPTWPSSLQQELFIEVQLEIGRSKNIKLLQHDLKKYIAVARDHSNSHMLRACTEGAL